MRRAMVKVVSWTGAGSSSSMDAMSCKIRLMASPPLRPSSVQGVCAPGAGPSASRTNAHWGPAAHPPGLSNFATLPHPKTGSLSIKTMRTSLAHRSWAFSCHVLRCCVLAPLNPLAKCSGCSLLQPSSTSGQGRGGDLPISPSQCTQ
jgi:hypothetical protein